MLKAHKKMSKKRRRFKKETARSSPQRKKVKNRKQVIAWGLSKARKKGAKCPQNLKNNLRRSQ